MMTMRPNILTMPMMKTMKNIGKGAEDRGRLLFRLVVVCEAGAAAESIGIYVVNVTKAVRLLPVMVHVFVYYI
jgi:hypothetical protein